MCNNRPILSHKTYIAHPVSNIYQPLISQFVFCNFSYKIYAIYSQGKHLLETKLWVGHIFNYVILCWHCVFFCLVSSEGLLFLLPNLCLWPLHVMCGHHLHTLDSQSRLFRDTGVRKSAKSNYNKFFVFLKTAKTGKETSI